MPKVAPYGFITVFAVTLFLLAPPAFAHTGSGIVGGFASGFTHPILGWDHVAAMVAVGLWGAFLGAPSLWVLPIAFPVVMAFGGALAVMGFPVPAVEAGIASSSVVLGLLIAFAVRAPLWVATIIVGAFAIFHGHAHGTELPEAANPLSYAVGFVCATGLLHLCGVGLGFLTRLPSGSMVIRASGIVIAVVGASFLVGIL